MINNYWICDSCGEKITKPEDGFIEWLRNNKNNKSNKFHLVHNSNRCLYNEKTVMDKGYTAPGNHLQYFINEDGLMKLLELLDMYNLVDPFEIIEMIKRTQIAGYDQVRFNFEKASSEGIIDGPRQHGYYPTTNEIKKLIN